ncbi:50S ribosomal protein L13 [Patescibacteria group bacterium]|nr:MAG: 50S ribosomal protein L13 [Patescibacteria group bacterium]
MSTITEYTIDAKGRTLGRVASEAASILMGKNIVAFARHKAPEVSVKIVNVAKLSISEKHLKNDKFAHFSGYQGGLKFETLGASIKRLGYQFAVKHAIRGMIPATRLRNGMLKRLIIVD